MLYSSSELFGQLPLLETGKKRELGRMRSPFLGRFDDGEHRLVGVNSDANADSGAFAIAVTADSSESSSRRGRTHPCVGRSALSVQLQLLYSRCWHLTESVASTSHSPSAASGQLHGPPAVHRLVWIGNPRPPCTSTFFPARIGRSRTMYRPSTRACP